MRNPILLLLTWLFPVFLNAWEWRQSNELPQENQIIVRLPTSLERIVDRSNYKIYITRWKDVPEKHQFISHGYYLVSDDDLLKLFRSDLTFVFYP